MNFPSWLKYVQELTDTRGLDIHDVREALILCGKPSRPVLPFDKSALTNRLTDVSRYFELVLVMKCHPQGIFYFCRYGGTHRLRFDSKGQGLGMAGRRDIRNILLSQPQHAVLQFHNSTI